mmetsp:Transcript_42003/g.105930  ORF Transcript_42003/g.105930 Transcript_42003/m.105930 type:complete len:253 (-) Transcript_42003:63-821(-)
MKWIYRQEDRVWRDRGGRPNEETAQQFLSFLQQSNAGYVALFFRRAQDATSERARLTGACVVGYAVGEYTSLSRREQHTEDQCPTAAALDGVLGVTSRLGDHDGSSTEVYEIVTAWVDPECRGLGLATDMYWKTMEAVERDGRTPYCSSDTISGGIDAIVRSSPVLRRLYALGAARWLISEAHANSYTVNSSSGGHETFARVVVHVPRLLGAMRLASTLQRTASLLLMPSAALATYLLLRYLNNNINSSSKK